MSQRLAAHAALALAALVSVGATVAHADEPERFSPTSRGERPSVTRWADLVAGYDWPVSTALRVIDCESEGDPDAINLSSGATGLMQLMPSWRWFAARLFGSADLTDPAVNVGVGYALYADSGYRFGFHWFASASCWGGR